MSESDDARHLRRGWTTGACATAAAKAAYTALLTGEFPDPVEITLPGGQSVAFALAVSRFGNDAATAGVIKDAGDDPDVTHGALLIATLRKGAAGSGVSFKAGPGVGTVTLPGLPVPPGEPAINPVPRRMMRVAITEVARACGDAGGVEIELSIPSGEELAAKTLNARLGIIGGLSILGTTGVVIPYSCAAWVHAIERGIDVARAAGLRHIAAATGAVSERAVQRLYRLPDHALIDMGDFVGGTLKYLRRHPIPRLTIGGGFAKLVKLAQGHLDLHSAKSRVDPVLLADMLNGLGADPALCARAGEATSAAEILAAAGAEQAALCARVAARARTVALAALNGETAVEVAIVGRDGSFLARVDG